MTSSMSDANLQIYQDSVGPILGLWQVQNNHYAVQYKHMYRVRCDVSILLGKFSEILKEVSSADQ